MQTRRRRRPISLRCGKSRLKSIRVDARSFAAQKGAQNHKSYFLYRIHTYFLNIYDEAY